ncbi:TetR/AcrR family transcriptional regulator [Corynebacterium lubricantis]|uniref:TetR/AcrR family transcriptional regulator n=1 Tax=Corynebacterium lubricantis TaxID=541095 RepID=UPI0003691A62|nr:TetR family transcriptional regulator [Corynebacterium lubricantis]
MNLREKQQAETHQHFLATAFDLFREQGYNATSMNQIATRAGFSRTALYQHFPNKPAIVLEHLSTVRLDLRELVLELGKAPEYSAEYVRPWLESLAQTWINSSEEFLAIEQAVAEDKHVAREWLTMINAIAENFPGGDDYGFRLKFVNLFLGTDRSFYFLYGRGFLDNEEQVMKNLTEQWVVALS